VTNVPATALPKLASTTNVITVTDLEIISFDRFGKLLSASATAPSIRVGEKAQPEGAWIPDGSSNFFELNIQPLTGRAVVIDRRATAR
jgi:hypothetical protein